MTSMTQWAPSGSRCSRCLCCDAVIVFNGESLCAACDDGTHPPLPEERKSRPDPPASETLTSIPALELALALGAEAPNSQQEKAIMSKVPSNRSNSGKRIEVEIKRAVLAASPSISNCELARRHGISDATVSLWRRAAGIKSIAKGVRTKAADPAPEPIAQSEPLPPAPAREAAPVVSVHMTVEEKLIDEWWKKLDLIDKAAIFGANYVIRLEGAIS